MPSKLGKYVLQRTLGQGAFSKVKQALNKENGEYYAIKIHRSDDHSFGDESYKVVETEARAIAQLRHPNIVNIIDFLPEAFVEKSNGIGYPVCCVIVEELAQGGELFYYVKNSGHFSERMARFFFHQMIEGLEYVHKKGMAHRDIKPDNILFDANFNIKIADFGFAGPLAGRTGTGYMSTQCGTKPYQAPEINEGKVYKGEEVDLFAIAIVLFIMVGGIPPFSQAVKEDFYYKLLMNPEKFELYWKYVCKQVSNGDSHFSAEFKDLMTKMFSYNPSLRLTSSQIKSHPWYTQTLPSQGEVLDEFKRRKEINDKESEQERAVKR